MYSTTIDYNGQTIVIENYMYFVATNPTKKYSCIIDVKKIIDKENFVDRVIGKLKTRTE